MEEAADPPPYTGPQAPMMSAAPAAPPPGGAAASFCHMCGSRVAEAARFCSSCGAKLEAPAATEEEPPRPDSAGEGPGQGPGCFAEPGPEKDEEEEDSEDEEGDFEEGGGQQPPLGARARGGKGGEDDFTALQVSLLQFLVSQGKPLTTGRLGFLVSAKKKATAAALFALKGEGLVEMRENIPPLWEPTDAGRERAEASGGGGGGGAVGRFAYDPSRRQRAGPRSSRDDFETLKVVVRNAVASKGRGGCTAGSLGFELGANRKAVNAALYACEKEGTAWAIGERASGVKARWGARPAEGPDADAELPPSYAYGGGGGKGGKGGAQVRPLPMAPALWDQPPPKRARAVASEPSGDDFETLKLILRSELQAKGEQGASSGQLGYELGAGRKHLTAALYSCEQEGTVKNVAEEGAKPRWICWLAPPDSAADLAMPQKFAYSGPDAGEPGAGGGKGAGRRGPAQGAAVDLSSLMNPVSKICEWGQKSRQQVSFADSGQDNRGHFVCKVLLDGQPFAQGFATNKKEAKKQAAEIALRQLGI